MGRRVPQHGPHAYIKKLNLEKARALPGVACVLDHTAIPGGNRFGIIIKDEPCLVDDKVRRYGDAIAVVAAETKELVHEALELIEVEYEELEPIFTVERAMEEDAPKIHGDSNVHAKKFLNFGDVDAAWDKCDIIIENTYSTHRLSHMFIEPDAGISYYDDQGLLTVIASTQNPHYDRGEVAVMLGIPANQVRVKQAATAAASAASWTSACSSTAPLMTYYTKRPVKMVRDRRESTMVSSKRHPITMHAKTGATKDGKLVAVDVTMVSDSGAYASYGPAVIGRAPVHIAGPYECPNVRCSAVFLLHQQPHGRRVPRLRRAPGGRLPRRADECPGPGPEHGSHRDPAEKRPQSGDHHPHGPGAHGERSFADTLKQAAAKAAEVM